VCVCVHVCLRVRACVHACLHACVRVCVRACVPACVCAYVYSCMRACMHTCMGDPASVVCSTPGLPVPLPTRCAHTKHTHSPSRIHACRQAATSLQAKLVRGDAATPAASPQMLQVLVCGPLLGPLVAMLGDSVEKCRWVGGAGMRQCSPVGGVRPAAGAAGGHAGRLGGEVQVGGGAGMQLCNSIGGVRPVEAAKPLTLLLMAVHNHFCAVPRTWAWAHIPRRWCRWWPC